MTTPDDAINYLPSRMLGIIRKLICPSAERSCPVSVYFRYFLNLLLRSMWRRGVEEFKRGMLSHDKGQQKSEVEHFQKQPAVKKEWETLFDIH